MNPSRLCVASVAFLGLTLSALADQIVVGAPSSGGNFFPFGGPFSTNPGTRYQQAYASTDFSGPMSINGLEFTLNNGSTLRSVTYQIFLSTITAGIDTLSNSNFNANRGADNALFASGTLSGASPATLIFTGGPFLYIPSSGNLLLDFVFTSPGANGNAGFTSRSGDATGIFSRYLDFGTATTGWGLVTTFDFAATPEPGTSLTAGLSILVVFRFAWMRRRQRQMLS